jgi:hypothetical protein
VGRKRIHGCSECGYTHCRATHDVEHFKKLYEQWQREARKYKKLAEEWMRDFDKLKEKHEPMELVPDAAPASASPGDEGGCGGAGSPNIVFGEHYK